MLNPSRADAATDDPKLRRVIGFARAAGFGQIRVTNLYGWRSPSPSVLRRVVDPVGVGNDQAILDAAAGATWSWPPGAPTPTPVAAAVLQLLSHRTVCLGPDPRRSAAPPPLRPRPNPPAGLSAPPR
jgi:hypothetical protein